MKPKINSITYIFSVGNILWSVAIIPAIDQLPLLPLKYQVFIYQVQNPEKKFCALVEFETGQPTVKNALIILEQVLNGKIK